MQKTLFLIPLLTASLSFGADLTQSDQREAYAIGASTATYLINQISGQEKLGIKTDKNIVIEGFLDVFKDGSKMKSDEVKFRQKVVPGDTLLFRVELLHPVRHGVSSMKGYMFVGDQVVSEATFTAQIVKNK